MIVGAANSPLPPLGHAHRLRMPRRALWLVVGHLFFVALALGDAEIARALGEVVGLGEAGVAVVEAGIAVAALTAWGALTAAWMRRRPDA